MNKPITLENVVINWAYLHKVDKYGKFSVQVPNLTEKQVKQLLDGGVPETKIKDGTGMKDKNGNDLNIGNFIQPSSKVPVGVVDSKTDSIEGDELGKIGNGTTANITVVAYPYTDFGGGISYKLVGVQIVELVEYNAQGSGTEQFKPLKKGYERQTIPETGTEDDVSF